MSARYCSTYFWTNETILLETLAGINVYFLTWWVHTAIAATGLSGARRPYSNISKTRQHISRPLTVTIVIDLSIVSKPWSSTYGIHQYMLQLLTVTNVIDLLIAKKPWSSTLETRQYIFRLLIVMTATGLSTVKKPWSSTCGIRQYTSRSQKPLWTLFFDPSRHSIIKLLSRQLFRIPSCRDTNSGVGAMSSPWTHGSDTRIH